MSAYLTYFFSWHSQSAEMSKRVFNANRMPYDNVIQAGDGEGTVLTIDMPP